MRPFLLLSSVLAFTLAAAGCSMHLGEDTAGEKGNLRFEYSSCLFGCSLDQSALQGSKVTIATKGGDPEVELTARLADASIATISSQSQSCSCGSSSGNESHSRSVGPSEKCASSEEKTCSLRLDLETHSAGDAKLEVTDAYGALVDRVTVHVRPAARIEVDVRDRKPAAGGVYLVGRGEKVKIASRVLDADGNTMIFAQHGVTQEYADKTVLGPDPSVLIGSTDVEDAVANKSGETSVTIRAVGAESVVRFRVGE